MLSYHTDWILGNNALSKTLPDEIQGLDVLKAFSMSFQFLIGTLPLDALANTMIAKKPHLFADQLGTAHYLEILSLENTTVSGTLSRTIANLPSLREIGLSGNKFSGTIPSTVGLLTSLEYVDVSEAFNGTIPPEIYIISSLNTFACMPCDLTGTIPDPTRVVPLLESLLLTGNRLSGTLPKGMDKFPNLVNLDISDNFLTGEVPSSVGELVNLEYLSLEKNSLRGKLLEQPFLYKTTALSDLLLGDNLFSGMISTEIGLWSNLWGLFVERGDRLKTPSTAKEQAQRLMGTIPTELGLLPKLTQIALQGNRLTGSIPTEIAQLPLFLLLLNHNELTGTFPTELALLTDIGM